MQHVCWVALRKKLLFSVFCLFVLFCETGIIICLCHAPGRTNKQLGILPPGFWAMSYECTEEDLRVLPTSLSMWTQCLLVSSDGCWDCHHSSLPCSWHLTSIREWPWVWLSFSRLLSPPDHKRSKEGRIVSNYHLPYLNIIKSSCFVFSLYRF